MNANEKTVPVVVGLGELLWDCFGDRRRPGGAPANVAYHASQLGLKGLVCSRVGADADGDELAGYLAEHGLATDLLQRDADHPTGKVTVHTTWADAPSYTIHENVAWDYLELTESWAAAFAQATAVCFGTLAQRHETSRATIRRAVELAAHALRVYDVNLRPPFYQGEWVEAALRGADVIKLNDQEVVPLADLVGLDAGRGLDAFAEGLLERFDARVACITRGAEGCLLASHGARAAVPGRAVKVADAVGAGDAFTAALTFGLLSDWPLEATAEFANEVGALVASREGAMPDVRAEFAALRSRFG